MLSLFIRFIIPALIILIVSELARRSPRLGALLLTLPLISILAFGGAWLKDHDLKSVSCLARETLILVPLGLPFFLPLAFAERFGLGFWTAMTVGFLMASTTIAVWFVHGPKCCDLFI